MTKDIYGGERIRRATYEIKLAQRRRRKTEEKDEARRQRR